MCVFVQTGLFFVSVQCVPIVSLCSFRSAAKHIPEDRDLAVRPCLSISIYQTHDNIFLKSFPPTRSWNRLDNQCISCHILLNRCHFIGRVFLAFSMCCTSVCIFAFALVPLHMFRGIGDVRLKCCILLDGFVARWNRERERKRERAELK